MNWIDRFRPASQMETIDVERWRSRSYTQAPQVVWVTQNGETVIFNIDRDTYECLNEVASSVWEIITTRGNVTFDRIIELLQEEFELPADESVDRMAKDVAALLDRLERARVLLANPMKRA